MTEEEKEEGYKEGLTMKGEIEIILKDKDGNIKDYRRKKFK